MEEVFKYGQMVQDMMASGNMILHKDMEDSFMLREMCMKGSGRMTKLMALESIHITMGIDTLATGRRTNNTAKVLKSGLTILNMMDFISSV